MKLLVSIPNPPVVGSVFEVPVRIKVSSTSNVVVFNVVLVPLTVKSPVIVKSPGIETVSLDAFPKVVFPPTVKFLVIAVSRVTVKSCPIVTSSGNAIVTSLLSVPEPVTVISLDVPVIVCT